MLRTFYICTIFITILFFICTITLAGDRDDTTDIVELSPKVSYSINHLKKEERILPGNSGKIEFPEGSLDKATGIEVQRIEIPFDKKKFTCMGDMFRFFPGNIRFKKPVRLTLFYTEQEGIPEEFIHIYYYNRAKNRWDVMKKIKQDMDNNLITAEIHHFSDYVPGTGSYAIEEKLSPNCTFAKNRNEYVDRYRGNLIIERTDVNIPGRGIDLVVKTGFNSDWYYRGTMENPEWVSEIEDKALYKIASGWHFKFPGLSFFTHTYFGEETFLYLSESGVDYNITNALSLEIGDGINTMAYVDGYKIYDEEIDGFNHHRIIELVREKVVLECDVYNNQLGTIIVTNVTVYLQDGRIVDFYDPQDEEMYDGKVHKIYDAARKNNLTFAYDETTGKIDSITDSIGRVLKFDYNPANHDLTLYLDDTADTYLIQYEINGNDELRKIKNLKHDNAGTMAETGYEYTTDPYKITITYPYGGKSVYEYAEKYCIVKQTGFYTKPMVDSHILKESNTNSPVETRLTTFTYYNTDHEELPECNPDPEDFLDIFVVYTDTIINTLLGNNEKRKIRTIYLYDNYFLTGELRNITYVYDNGWSIDKATTNKFVTIVPDFHKVQKTSVYFNPTSDTDLGDYSYYFQYNYDWYGQIIREKKGLSERK